MMHGMDKWELLRQEAVGAAHFFFAPSIAETQTKPLHGVHITSFQMISEIVKCLLQSANARQLLACWLQSLG